MFKNIPKKQRKKENIARYCSEIELAESFLTLFDLLFANRFFAL